MTTRHDATEQWEARADAVERKLARHFERLNLLGHALLLGAAEALRTEFRVRCRGETADSVDAWLKGRTR